MDSTVRYPIKLWHKNLKKIYYRIKKAQAIDSIVKSIFIPIVEGQNCVLALYNPMNNKQLFNPYIAAIYEQRNRTRP